MNQLISFITYWQPQYQLWLTVRETASLTGRWSQHLSSFEQYATENPVKSLDSQSSPSASAIWTNDFFIWLKRLIHLL